MSKLDMQEGTEVLLSDAIERFWLPISSAAAGVGAPVVAGGTASASVSCTASFMVGPGSGSSTAEGGGAGSGGIAGPPLSTSSSMAGLARNTSDAELSGAVAAAAAAQLAAAGGGGGEGGQPGQPPRVEMPWWTYGARGMQAGGGRMLCEDGCLQSVELPAMQARAAPLALLVATLTHPLPCVSSCGVCATPSLSAALVPFVPLRAAHTLPALAVQPNRHRTGGGRSGGSQQLNRPGEATWSDCTSLRSWLLWGTIARCFT